MLVAAGVERGLGNRVCVAVVCDHDVLIATVRLDGELSTAVYVQFSDEFIKYMAFIGRGEGRSRRGDRRRARGRTWGLGLYGADTLAALIHVAFDCLF